MLFPFLTLRCVPQGERCVMHSARSSHVWCALVPIVWTTSPDFVGLSSGHAQARRCSCHSSHLTVSLATFYYRRSFLVDLPTAASQPYIMGRGQKQGALQKKKCGRGDGGVVRSICESTSPAAWPGLVAVPSCSSVEACRLCWHSLVLGPAANGTGPMPAPVRLRRKPIRERQKSTKMQKIASSKSL